MGEVEFVLDERNTYMHDRSSGMSSVQNRPAFRRPDAIPGAPIKRIALDWGNTHRGMLLVNFGKRYNRAAPRPCT